MKDSREVGRLVRMDQGLTLATPTRLTPSLRPRFLVCAPDYFDAHFLFNPFMRHTDVVDRRRAKRQWGTFVCVLESAGAELEIMAAEPVTAALPFTADGAFFYAPGRAVVLRNDGGRGELEPPVFAAWLARHGYSTEPLPPRYRLDGGNLLRLETGDVLAGLKPGVEGLAERYLARLLRLSTPSSACSAAAAISSTAAASPADGFRSPKPRLSR